jgi:hypothetical protein
MKHMKPILRGIAIAFLQCLIVLSLAGKYAIDRERLPRAWARALPVDPNLPIRGRYVRLRLEVDVPDDRPAPGIRPNSTGVNAWPAWSPVQLSAGNGRLVATPVTAPTGAMLSSATARGWALQEPVAFFIPEHVPDPSRRLPGEELWVEVSVPRKGPPRPVRLGVKKDGVLTPLTLR